MSIPNDKAGPKPVAPLPKIDGIPSQLTERDQWVCWAYVQREGRFTKEPRKPASPKKRASSTDSSTWASLAGAFAAFEANRDVVDGIGFVFAEDDPFFGVDIDHCIGPDGEVLEWAASILEKYRGIYGEISPSGTGLKFFGVGAIPDGKGHKVSGLGPDEAGAIEAYPKGRFFTTTGGAWEKPSPGVCEAQGRLDWTIAEIERLREENKARKRPNQPSIPNATPEAKASSPIAKTFTSTKGKPPAELSDGELVALARSAKDGGKFSGLYDQGDTSGHAGDDSSADLALMNLLAFWTDRDAERMRRLFGTSALGKREKWGRRDYQDATIAKAIEGCSNTYTGGRSRKHADNPWNSIEQKPEVEGLGGQVKKIVEEGGFPALFRDNATLLALAWTSEAKAAEFLAIKGELKGIKGFSSRDFTAAVKAAKPTQADDWNEHEDPATSPYYSEFGSTFMCGEKGAVRLCNFVARIDEEIIKDDGTNEPPSRALRIKGVVQGRHAFDVEVDSKDFSAMSWVIPKVGARAIVDAGPGAEKHLRAAIQELSEDIKRKLTFTHTGWRKDAGGHWIYLSASGAIGVGGLDASVAVDLGDSLNDGYRLPDPPSGERLKVAIRAKLAMSRFGQDARINSRALAAICGAYAPRAILGNARMAIEFRGGTGTFKSMMAALNAQSFGSALTADTQLSWSSTVNATQYHMHVLKDVGLIIDDYVLNGNSAEVAQKQADYDRIFRAAGNGQGRERMNRDGTLAREMKPRAMILSTGEDRGTQASAWARTYSISFAPRGASGTVDVDVLTECQKDAKAGLYAEATSGFIRWLAPQLDYARDWVAGRAEELRPLATIPDGHARTAGIIGELVAAYEIFLCFAVEAGAITVDERQQYFQGAWDGLMDGSEQTTQEIKEQGTPGERYLRLLVSSINSSRAFLADKETGDVPNDLAGACGWIQTWKLEDGRQHPFWQPAPNAIKIGWVDDDSVYLDPDTAYRTALGIARAQGENLPTKHELHIQLSHAGMLAKTDSRSISGAQKNPRITSRESCERQRQYVLVVSRSVFWPEPEDAPPQIRLKLKRAGA